MRFHRLLGALLLCYFGSIASVTAQTWPTRTVRIIVPTAAGSSVDIVARIVAERLGTKLDKNVIVENKPGGGGTIGVDAVAKAQDGHTLLLGYNGPLTVAPSFKNVPPYEVARDLKPIILAVTQPNVLAVRADLGVNSVQELVALAKAKPGKLNYGSVGIGSLSNLSMEYFKLKSEVAIEHIPYNGGPAAALAITKGEVDVMFAALSNAQPLVKAGKAKLLATSNARRSVALPDLPTLAESGFPGFSATTWNGFLAPSDMPDATVLRLNALIGEILKDPEVRERLLNSGAEVAGGSPQEFAELLRAETKSWQLVITRSGIKFD